MSNISETKSAFPSNVSYLFKPDGCHEWPCSTREIDTAGWLFEKVPPKTNLTVIPSLAIIIFLTLVFLKMYKWYKDNIKRKARGDVEFGDESEVNYGIIKEGDSEFCRVEMRSDTTSVYDTVTSYRLFGNGHATGIPHDSVGSYKSLVMQRGDASHYDSVKSYKAFLRQVTQNKDLDVEVKLLENYPMKCKSAEHCVVVEEDCGPWKSTKSRLVPGNINTSSNDKKKNRFRRASGDPLGPMRKRSASNPTYNCRYPGATSLPSIHYSVSSDSSNEDDTLSAFKMERKKAFEDRCKKISRSCSGGKLTKVSNSTDKILEEECEEQAANPKRKRHYSADGGSRLGKLPIGYGHKHFKISRAFQHELNNLRESISETDPKPEEHLMVLVTQEESSSENPDSSPSPCDSSVSSDAIESESEDDDTKLITQISAVSDCTTVISNRELASSAEILSTHSANSDGFTCSSDVGCSLSSSQQTSNNNDNHITSSQLKFPNSNGHGNDISHVIVSDNSPQNINDNVSHQCSDLEKMHDESSSIANNNIPSNVAKNTISSSSTLSQYSPSHHRSSSSPTTFRGKLLAEVEDSEDTDNSVASNPRRVKRFHVTSVQKDDLASLKAESHWSSSGGKSA